MQLNDGSGHLPHGGQGAVDGLFNRLATSLLRMYKSSFPTGMLLFGTAAIDVDGLLTMFSPFNWAFDNCFLSVSPDLMVLRSTSPPLLTTADSIGSCNKLFSLFRMKTSCR